ncbi:MAG TPA: hypothetical protein VFE82_04555 [Ramlibacter sp.]|jgi:hypothetical protein|uniref:hypothetical protein n=1 Tax=Ramlibacter sp. TaxID=1917967 RepID=UPI002D589062|nr:hypothetical protein [Ramlibacter sp.]HZY17727.1 hypothetical protein [Ramlibacter sp.]
MTNSSTRATGLTVASKFTLTVLFAASAVACGGGGSAGGASGNALSTGASVSAQATPPTGPAASYGTPTRVHASAAGQQTLRSVGTTPDGYAVAWLSEGDGSPTAVHLQHFSTGGARIGGDTAAVLDAAQTATVAAVLADGGMALASAQTSAPADQPWITRTSIVVRRYDAAGSAVGAPLEIAAIDQNRVGGTTMHYVTEPAVVRLDAGGFVVGWSVIREDANGRSPQFWTQRFDAAGQPAGGPVQAGTGDLNTSYSLTAAPNGGYVLTTSTRVMGRTFLHYTGFDGASAPVLPAGAPGVAEGSVLLPLQGGGSVLLSPVQNVGSYQLYAADGQPQGAAGSLRTMPVAAAALRDGGYVLFSATATAGELEAQRYDRAGQPVRGATAVSTSGGAPRAALLADDSLGLAWTAGSAGDADVMTQLLRP